MDTFRYPILDLVELTDYMRRIYYVKKNAKHLEMGFI